MDAMQIALVVLYIGVIALGVMLWALSRQVGILFERISPMGALMTDSGPKVGEASPVFSLSGVLSQPVTIGGKQDRPSLIFFLAPTCPVCKKLLPIVKSLSQDEGKKLHVILASDGETSKHLEFIRAYDLSSLPYVVSNELGMSYRVSRLPYAVVIDQNGVVAAKGLVNSREQLDSLLNAYDMQTPSVQAYLSHVST